MKVATTIQLSPDEDSLLVRIKQKLRLANKKAVVLEGIRLLDEQVRGRERASRLARASGLVRAESRSVNREWAPISTAVRE